MHSLDKKPTPEQINQMMAAHSPFHKLIECVVERISEQAITCRMPIQDSHFHAAGYLHGGVTYALADSAVASLILWNIGFDRKTYTIEGKLNYLAALPAGTDSALIVTAKMVHLGKSTAVVDADVYSESERLLCHGIFTYALR